MGLTVVDAGVLIGFVEDPDSHFDSAVAAIRAARARGDDIAIPATALSEALVRPMRTSGAVTRRVFDVIERLPVAVVAIDEPIAIKAAEIRAVHRSLRLPDAVVIAAAAVRSADYLITTDRRWPTKRALKFPGRIVVL